MPAFGPPCHLFEKIFQFRGFPDTKKTGLWRLLAVKPLHCRPEMAASDERTWRPVGRQRRRMIGAQNQMSGCIN
jgi:hypothetical protein